VSDISAVWDSLTPSTTTDNGYVRLRLPSITACATYVARHIGDELEAVILEVATSALPAITAYPQSVGFVVVSEPLEHGRAGKTRLILSLTHVRFRDVFRALCEDVTRNLLFATSETEAASIFVSRLVRWQAFLRKHDPGGLSLEQRRGLVGELILLQKLLLEGVSSESAVMAWTGCRGTNHDFQFSCASIEVKTTGSNTPHAFNVSNAGQLDDSGVEALFLHLVIVDESEGGAASLPELVQSVRLQLADAAAGEFDDSLREVGFLDVHSELYSSPRYTVRSNRYFHVVSGFPRLLGSTLPEGVEDVKYRVALAACTPFETQWQQIVDQIQSSPEGSND
jgi:hypothetical protein